MAKLFIKAKARRFFDRIRNANHVLSVPGTGVQIAMSDRTELKPTRFGVNSKDGKTPFVQTDVKQLGAYYSYYLGSLEFRRGILPLPYAETIPLCWGEMGFRDGFDLRNFRVLTRDLKYTVPAPLEAHGKCAIELFKQLGNLRCDARGEWENNACLRVERFDTNAGVITVSSASYFDQIATNLTLDWASGHVPPDELTSPRHLEPPVAGKLCPLHNSIYANTLGVAAMVIDPNDDMLIRIRGGQQAIMDNAGGQFHCSASGVFALDHVANPDDESCDLFLDGMRDELRSEIGLEPDEYTLYPVAFSRELVRGGKPQLFFIARTLRPVSELHLAGKDAEEAWEFIDFGDVPERSPLAKYLDAPSQAPAEMFTYEAQMAIALAASCIEGSIPPVSFG